ncbi:MAG: alkaline phosphatase family protein [Micrococcus sp.]|nr:alkaline phosphatase family protein [Micrococcus sp.]
MTTAKVLLVGIDGVRFDILQQARTPTLDRLAGSGCHHSMAIPEEGITVSGPMWSSILTGTWPTEHGVYDNSTAPERRLPDVFTRLGRQGMLTRPIAVAAWQPIVAATGCGPLVDPTLVDCVPIDMPDESPESYIAGDRTVLQIAQARLADPAVDAAFVYFGEVDEVGHRDGVSDRYRAAIERADSLLGELLDHLDARTDREDWTVIVTTDHGHVDGGGHGGTTLAERQVWVTSDRELGIVSPVDIAPAIYELVSAGHHGNSCGHQAESTPDTVPARAHT